MRTDVRLFLLSLSFSRVSILLSLSLSLSLSFSVLLSPPPWTATQTWINPTRDCRPAYWSLLNSVAEMNSNIKRAQRCQQQQTAAFHQREKTSFSFSGLDVDEKSFEITKKQKRSCCWWRTWRTSMMSQQTHGRWHAHTHTHPDTLSNDRLVSSAHTHKTREGRTNNKTKQKKGGGELISFGCYSARWRGNNWTGRENQPVFFWLLLRHFQCREKWTKKRRRGLHAWVTEQNSVHTHTRWENNNKYQWKKKSSWYGQWCGIGVRDTGEEEKSRHKREHNFCFERQRRHLTPKAKTNKKMLFTLRVIIWNSKIPVPLRHLF